MEEETCPDCKGKGIVKEKDGTYHVCYRCLLLGRLDQHTRPKESRIRV